MQPICHTSIQLEPAAWSKLKCCHVRRHMLKFIFCSNSDQGPYDQFAVTNILLSPAIREGLPHACIIYLTSHKFAFLTINNVLPPIVARTQVNFNTATSAIQSSTATVPARRLPSQMLR